MNTNGTLPNDDYKSKPQNAVACLTIIIIFMAAFFCGGLTMLLVVQPALLNLVAACLQR